VQNLFKKMWEARGSIKSQSPGENQLFQEIADLKKGAIEEAEVVSKFNDGFFGRLASNKKFEGVTMIVILFNAIEIGWDADHKARFESPDNLFEGPVGFAVFETFFAIYFSVEILIRLLGFKRMQMCITDAWFVFDSILVIFMVSEILMMAIMGGGGPLAALSILRLLRLLRITRMAKLMRLFPELMMIVTGLRAATKAVVWTAILLVIVTYTWAILFVNEYHETGPDDSEDTAVFFGTMGKAMFTLLVMGTILDDVTAVTNAMKNRGDTVYLLLFIGYIVLNSFTMLNMLVGILVEVVGATAAGEKMRLVEGGVRESIVKIFNEMDEDHSGMISRDEFINMKSSPEVMKALQELDIKEKHFDMFVELLFQPDDNNVVASLDFDTLLDSICRLRPGTSVSSLDFSAFKQLILQGHLARKSKVLAIETACNLTQADTSSTVNSKGLAPNAASLGNSESESSDQGMSLALLDTLVSGEGPAAAAKSRADMLADLARIDSATIISELQRRLANSAVTTEAVVPQSSGAFRLGAPQQDAAEWSQETLSC